MTNQTTAPLGRLRASAGNESLTFLATRDGLILDAPYQRGSVWGPDRQRNLIRSALLGLPLGMIYLNERPGTASDVVIDGKQRIETFRALMNNELNLPASWFEDADYGDFVLATNDGPYIRWINLTERGKGKIMRTSVSVMRMNLPTVDDEAAVFDLINFGGVPQGQAD